MSRTISSTMSLVDLNLDVLDTIVSLLSSADALRLSATARGLYSIAIRQATLDVRLNGPWRCLTFCYFVAKGPARVSSMRSLAVGHRAYKFPDIWHIANGDLICAAFVRTLEHATKLRCIDLSCAEIILADTRLASALANLLYLEDITLDDIGDTALTVLSQLRSKPRRLEISMLHDIKITMSIIPSNLQPEEFYFHGRYRDDTAGVLGR
ncbi:hypothetical protein BKA93DRAFT_119532 [Sparassis latifolia]